MKSCWITYKDKRVFFADYSGFGSDSDALAAEVSQAIDTIALEPQKSVLVLSDFTGTTETIKNLDIVRRLVKHSNAAVIKRALLGLGGVRQVFITTFGNVLGGMKVQAFDSREEALDWLVRD